jgi:predicted deacylase
MPGQDVLTIGDVSLRRGERGVVDLPVGRLVSHAQLDLRVNVIRGRKPGPVLFVSAGIHGDEINGVEIARRLVGQSFKGLKGDILIVPVVNVSAFLLRSRYLPDRRDLNRLFPGNPDGSFGARIARTLIDEVVKKSTHGIDLHTAATGRINLPQTRMADRVEGSREMAKAFGAPVMLKAGNREGSLRAACENLDMPYVLFEAGEALRLDLPSVTFGVRGVMRVMRSLGMLRKKAQDREHPSAYCSGSSWRRASAGGIFRSFVPLGKAVEAGQVLGIIADPFDEGEVEITAEKEGIVIGRTTASLVDEGDALFHIAQSQVSPGRAEERIILSAEEVIPDTEQAPYHDQ